MFISYATKTFNSAFLCETWLKSKLEMQMVSGTTINLSHSSLLTDAIKGIFAGIGNNNKLKFIERAIELETIFKNGPLFATNIFNSNILNLNSFYANIFVLYLF